MYMTIHETNRKNGKLTEVTFEVVLKSKRGNIIYYFYLYN